jgi:hypothetical protein
VIHYRAALQRVRTAPSPYSNHIWRNRWLANDPHIAPLLTAEQRASLTGPSPGAHDSMASYLVRFHPDVASDNIRRLHSAGVRIPDRGDAANFGPRCVCLVVRCASGDPVVDRCELAGRDG